MVSAGPLVGIGFGNPFVVVSRKAVPVTDLRAHHGLILGVEK